MNTALQRVNNGSHNAVKRNFFCLGGDENTLALGRYARKLGLGAIYFDYDKSMASVSKNIRFYKLEKTSQDDLLERLLETKRIFGEEKPFIFFNSDYFVSFADLHRETLAKEFQFAIPGPKIVECALDKGKMSKILPPELLPDTFAIETSDDLISLTPPINVKPRNTSLGMPFKTMRLNSSSEIKDFARRYSDQLTNFLVQEVVGEPGGRLISVFFYRNHSGEFYSVAMERERMHPHWGGVGCLIKRAECAFTAMLENLLSQMEYVGLGEIDTFESANRITIFDLNMRLPSWVFFAEKCGIDLVGMYLKDLSNGIFSPAKPFSHFATKNCKAIDLINDIDTVFNPKNGLLFNKMLTPGQYVRSLWGIRYFYTLSIREIAPFLYNLRKELSHLLKKKNVIK